MVKWSHTYLFLDFFSSLLRTYLTDFFSLSRLWLLLLTFLSLPRWPPSSRTLRWVWEDREDSPWRPVEASKVANSLLASVCCLTQKLTAAVARGTSLARWGRRPLFDLPLLSSIQKGSCLRHVLLAASTHAHTERAKSHRQGKYLAKLVHHG